MGVFGHFKKSEPELSNEEKRLNQMWALWAESHADFPWRDLMTYQGEINKGGHDRYFLNTGNTGDLQKEMVILETVLPEKLQSNLRKAYAAYRALSRVRWEGTGDIGTMRRRETASYTDADLDGFAEHRF